MAKYRKKPVVIEARLFTGGKGHKDLCEWCGATPIKDGREVVSLLIPTREGDMRADIGDFIIKGVAGEFYPCKADIFAETYEAV
ncbi:hypothetical protein [Ruegeria sp. HKCCD6109]|uniref:hypothetical protein n=1 Tax=Ruegeria sp. HKCCD6109 TaxID=2683017 RepID=UPI001490D40E|nr:hypothetical protein [Ruegeria sp. HKCCD6109]NOD65762.1 hypothetical protein [Ruegeria sp. HKCCD6109]